MISWFYGKLTDHSAPDVSANVKARLLHDSPNSWTVSWAWLHLTLNFLPLKHLSLASLVENYRLFLFLISWQLEKKRAPKECTWCAPSYFCVWSVHMCVCPQGSSGSVSRMKSECLVWSTVRSLYLTSDLRCDCPVKDLIESNLKRTNATRVAYRTPMLCDQLKRQRCLLSH